MDWSTGEVGEKASGPVVLSAGRRSQVIWLTDDEEEVVVVVVVVVMVVVEEEEEEEEESDLTNCRRKW